MSSFYFPITTEILSIPLIVYPCLGCEYVFDRRESGGIKNYLRKLYEDNQSDLMHGQYHIVLLWGDVKDRMADVWVFADFESWQAGPSVEVVNFREAEKYVGGAVTAGDGLVMLGHEEEWRRSKDNLEEFLSGNRPKLPEGIAPEEAFYVGP